MYADNSEVAKSQKERNKINVHKLDYWLKNQE